MSNAFDSAARILLPYNPKDTYNFTDYGLQVPQSSQQQLGDMRALATSSPDFRKDRQGNFCPTLPLGGMVDCLSLWVTGIRKANGALPISKFSFEVRSEVPGASTRLFVGNVTPTSLAPDGLSGLLVQINGALGTGFQLRGFSAQQYELNFMWCLQRVGGEFFARPGAGVQPGL